MPPLAETQTGQATQPVWIELNRENLLHNFQELKRFANPKTAVMTVIKANAYGHGLVQVAKTLAASADYFGVSSIAEALTLKALNLGVPIFVFGKFFVREIPQLLSPEITLTVSTFDEARDINDFSQTLSYKTKIHVKVDTGMGRMGLPYRDAVSLIEKMAALPHLELEGIYTHFPTAEVEDDFAARQMADLALVIRALEKKGIRFRYRHSQNSAGTVLLKSDAMTMIRPGLMLYGIHPSDNTRSLIDLKPVLSLKSRINLLKLLRPGESAGYGRTFMAKELNWIGILPIGYSHGYPWSASGKSWCLIRGKRYPIAGRVSMDFLAVDLGPDAIPAGEEVTLIGEDEGEKISAEDLASWAGTIPYEIVTQLSSHLPRYLK